jgi:deoxyribodipyrimidine photolyase-related protein
MSNYCDSCKYKPDIRFGEMACPITTLYWNFLIRHRSQFESSPRTKLMTANLKRISDEDQKLIVEHAGYLLNHLDDL